MGEARAKAAGNSGPLGLTSFRGSAVLDAMVYYVSEKTGGDDNDGKSPAKAFKSIQRAMHVGRPGDTLLIVPGIFDQDLDEQIEAARAFGLIVAIAGPNS
jgi:hypothetical protein